MERNLQEADLTINFDCEDWFANENPYDEYTQMYERAVMGNVMVLRSNKMNDATARAEVDNDVSFPKNWRSDQGQTPLQRGQQPGLQARKQGGDRIMTQMNTGPLRPAGDAEGTGFHATNPHFNPQTKQIFLGLNYGRRQHGAAPNYEKSYFVLKPDLKKKCMFYAKDTFLQRNTGADPDALQVPFGNLGAILGAKRSPALQDAILESCVGGIVQLPDTDDVSSMFQLIEAHFFGSLLFREDFECVMIAREGLKNPNLWAAIKANAKTFADKHGIGCHQTV